jgi:hypothetical protein
MARLPKVLAKRYIRMGNQAFSLANWAFDLAIEAFGLANWAFGLIKIQLHSEFEQ